MKVKREFYGNRHKQDSHTKHYISNQIAWETAVFEAYGGEIQYIKNGVSGAKPWKRKIDPSRKWPQGVKLGKS